ADKIFAGIVNEQEVLNALFMGLRPKLTKELQKRRADEVLWIAAYESKELKKLKDYVETYDNEAPEYIGRHIDEANSLISLIENDDAEWYDARSKDSISAYRHYLDIYDNPAPSYRGKYIDQVNEAIKVVKDRDDWAKAKESNSIRSYSEYLSMYDKEAPAYIGRFVNDAKSAIHSLGDDAAWQLASNLNTVESYKTYLDKYDVASSSYRGKYVESAKQKIEDLLPPPPPDPRIADDEAWSNAIKHNTIESYKEYLYEYANQQKTYKGIHVKDAKQALFRLQDEADWNVAKSEHTIDSYQHYLSIYSASSEFIGQHIDEARQAIDKLTPLDPRIEDDNAWKEAIRINSLDGYRHYLSLYKNHANEAELAIRHLIDEKAWKDAKEGGIISSYEKYLSICKVNEYPGYEWAHVNAAKTQIGNLRKADEANRKEEERKRRIAEDNAAWEKARKDNTKHSYEEYLAKYRKSGGLHIRETEYAILKLQSEEDWEKSRAENTLAAYKRFVDKYEPMSNKYMSMHLPEAKKKVKELTQKPDPNPIKWKKWLFIVLALALCWFLWIQFQDDAWPFNIFQGEPDEPDEQDVVVVENVDSLQWAIDNHNIPKLIKYANLDSVRAYYPLALALNAQDSVANVEKTLHWLDIILDPDVNSLHQNIINDIQQKELDELVSRFNAINPNEKDADRKYLAVYKDYIQHFERLATHTPLKIVTYMPIEDMANAQITDRKKHEELRTSILIEWETQQSRLRTILSNIDDNAKKAYSNKQ
ncbi:MAG: hypothetical protein NC453_15575, partial [Muribaculum sp.]|nr:hypothetical protein [Muribaculum sp.]